MYNSGYIIPLYSFLLLSSPLYSSSLHNIPLWFPLSPHHPSHDNNNNLFPPTHPPTHQKERERWSLSRSLVGIWEIEKEWKSIGDPIGFLSLRFPFLSPKFPFLSPKTVPVPRHRSRSVSGDRNGNFGDRKGNLKDRNALGPLTSRGRGGGWRPPPPGRRKNPPTIPGAGGRGHSTSGGPSGVGGGRLDH